MSRYGAVSWPRTQKGRKTFTANHQDLANGNAAGIGPVLRVRIPLKQRLEKMPAANHYVCQAKQRHLAYGTSDKKCRDIENEGGGSP